MAHERAQNQPIRDYTVKKLKPYIDCIEKLEFRETEIETIERLVGRYHIRREYHLNLEEYVEMYDMAGSRLYVVYIPTDVTESIEGAVAVVEVAEDPQEGPKVLWSYI